MFNPLSSIQTRIDLAGLRKYSSDIQDLAGEVHRFDAAREIHERLSQFLGDKTTFFGMVIEELKEGEKPQE